MAKKKKVVIPEQDIVQQKEMGDNDWNTLMSMMTKLEGGSQISVAQVKEVFSLFAALEATYRIAEYNNTKYGGSLGEPNIPMKIIMKQVDNKISKAMKEKKHG